MPSSTRPPDSTSSVATVQARSSWWCVDAVQVHDEVGADVGEQAHLAVDADGGGDTVRNGLAGNDVDVRRRGRRHPARNTVTNPGPSASDAVTFNTTAAASAGTPF